MTPCLANLIDVVEGQKLGVEVAYGHIIKSYTITSNIKIAMQYANGCPISVTLSDVMYVPGLSC